MSKSLLDTDIYSEVLKGVDPVVVGNAIAYRQFEGILTVSSVTVMEIVRGYRRRQGMRKIQAFLAAVSAEDVLGFDRAAAELTGEISGELDHLGRPIGVTDPMIAAVAIRHSVELVTGNTAHFQRIRQLGYPLALANWRLPRP